MKLHLELVVLPLLAILAASAVAEVYPGRPVHVIVPNATSGLADICTRLVAAKLGDALGQPFLVENRPGAGGTVGTAAAARSAPDGYTLLAVFDSHATNPSLFRDLPYDTLTDFAPVSLLARGPLVLVVNASLGPRAVEELVALARAKPGEVNFATVGPGSPARLLMEMLKLEARIDVTMVPYKGAGVALGDLVSGQVHAMFATAPSVSAHLKSGRLRALAVTSARRGAVLPRVPAMSETYPGFVSESWVALLAPAKTPTEIVARLNAEAAKALGRPDTKARLAELGLVPAAGSPEDLDRWIRAEMERWARVIREQRITLE